MIQMLTDSELEALLGIIQRLTGGQLEVLETIQIVHIQLAANVSDLKASTAGCLMSTTTLIQLPYTIQKLQFKHASLFQYFFTHKLANGLTEVCTDQ